MKGKLIVLEGTDCSGKETQSNMLVEYLNTHGCKTVKMAFPNYNSPTGKIIAGAYLGKEGFMEPVFPEGASNVDPYCASLLFAMDRKYNIKNIIDVLNSGVNVVLDRYVDSNIAHQSAKLPHSEQAKMINFLETLEYELLELPRADFEVLLYMPTWASKKLKSGRKEKPDQHELDEDYLLKSENVYLEIAERRNILTIDCTKNQQIKTIEQISQELCSAVAKYLQQCKFDERNV